MMNQRLVESVAQIVLAMSEDERRLLDRTLQRAGLRQLDDLEAAEKSLRITEIAQDIQEFEELHHSPLSELSVEHWLVAEPSSPGHSTVQFSHRRSTKPLEQNSALDSVLPVNEYTAETPKRSEDLPQSFFQPMRLLHSDVTAASWDADYAPYEAPSQNDRF
ncbi:MAG: hypothetical protein AAGB19_05770 [Cyanobacteria bacterium P01_F01_bin.3]